MTPWGGLPLALVLAAPAAGHDFPLREVSDRAVHADEPAYATTVQVRFLGVAGFLIRRGADAVLTAPLYSNPDIFKVLSEKRPVILPRPERVARFHPDVEDVKAILVGHAHYDHLMDVPYVWERTPEALILGSRTARNILLGYRGRAPDEAKVPDFPPFVPKVDPHKVVALDVPGASGRAWVDARSCQGWTPCNCRGAESCVAPDGAGQAFEVSARVRVRAFCARHPAQFLKHHQAPCCVDDPRGAPPAAIDDFREGNTLAYLVDFHGDDGRLAFRVYYQDVPVDGPTGLLPEDVIAERPVDLALLCAGNAGEVSAPEAIVGNLGAKAVIVGHWEDFFQPQDEVLLEAPFQNVGRYHRALRRALDVIAPGESRPLYVPRPGVLMTFPALP